MNPLMSFGSNLLKAIGSAPQAVGQVQNNLKGFGYNLYQAVHNASPTVQLQNTQQSLLNSGLTRSGLNTPQPPSGIPSKNLPNPVKPQVMGASIAQPATPITTPIPAAPTPQGFTGRNPQFSQKVASPQVQQAILGAAKEFNLPVDLLADVAWNEGGFRADAANTSAEGQQVGVPRGIFQFTPGTWNSDLVNYARDPNSSLKNWLVNNQAPDRNDPAANARAAAYLISHGQLSRWDASKSDPRFPNFGWGKFYQPNELSPYYSQGASSR
jgi:hypothetical protein